MICLSLAMTGNTVAGASCSSPSKERLAPSNIVAPSPIFPLEDSPTLTFPKTEPSLPILPCTKIVLMNTLCVFYLPSPPPPRLTPLANRPPWLAKLPRCLRKKSPPYPRSAPPRRHSHGPILPPLRRSSLRLHASRVSRLRP